MKILNIETEIKLIELKTPFITALRRVESVEFVRVKVSCENKVVAFGEAPATKAITGEGVEEILYSIETVREPILGESPQDSLAFIHEQSIGSSAKAALDMAFVSLMAQEKQQKLYEYLGAKEPCDLQTDITISLGSEDKMIRDAKEAYKEGMDILKIKVGKDVDHAIKVVRELCIELPKVKILVDANQAWNLEESLMFINAMKGVKIELIEQPVAAEDLDALCVITKSTPIDILADEAVFTLEDVKKVYTHRCADIINIKLMKCGGLSKAVEILEYARANDIKCMLGSMLEGPISINAALHLAMAYSDVIKYLDLDSPLLYKTPSDELDFLYAGSQVIYL
ncbi:MAG: dipeptide epimerase [Sulfurimonas sp.]|nr:dipeptide epimerase [Sulfurimonas sp.]MBU1218069.1 dipeptide epimerase [bacterium]MBU1434768.1 dipeptide epimerase [bacterium]MBU1502756.1 dipeptide epimerase [bacterium]MBU3940122.1 dipeptide epimerase [bacterium]